MFWNTSLKWLTWIEQTTTIKSNQIKSNQINQSIKQRKKITGKTPTSVSAGNEGFADNALFAFPPIAKSYDHMQTPHPIQHPYSVGRASEEVLPLYKSALPYTDITRRLV